MEKQRNRQTDTDPDTYRNQLRPTKRYTETNTEQEKGICECLAKALRRLAIDCSSHFKTSFHATLGMVFAILVSKVTDHRDQDKQKRESERHLRMFSKGIEEVGD